MPPQLRQLVASRRWGVSYVSTGWTRRGLRWRGTREPESGAGGAAAEGSPRSTRPEAAANPRPRTNCLRVSGQEAGARESPASSTDPPGRAVSRTLGTETQQGQPPREEFWAFMIWPEIATSGIEPSHRGRNNPSRRDILVHHIVFFVRSRWKVNRIVPGAAACEQSRSRLAADRGGRFVWGSSAQPSTHDPPNGGSGRSWSAGLFSKPEMPRDVPGTLTRPEPEPGRQNPSARPFEQDPPAAPAAAVDPSTGMLEGRDPSGGPNRSCPPLRRLCPPSLVPFHEG